MELMSALSGWASSSFQFYDPSQYPSSSNPLYQCPLNAVKELGCLLSPNASIIIPEDDRFAEATSRWTTWKKPNVTIVVEVATEKDIQETVKYANHHDILFLAMSGGHGAISSLGSISNGIEIWMRKMNTVSIAPDGQSATIGGGVLAKEVTDALWAVNKQTVTGFCECTGVLGPLLGGGHGVLQGEYGLLADNLVAARVVLANGTAVTVSSTSYPDLFWGLRGAGHNFGIVTEFTYKIYDVPKDDSWAFETLIYTGDKVEEVYEQINGFPDRGEEDVEVANFSFFAWMPDIDPKAPVIILTFISHTQLPTLTARTLPLHSLLPVFARAGSANYPDLPSIVGMSKNDPACSHAGATILRFPLYLMNYNSSAQRKVYEKFTELTTEYSMLQGSMFLFEGYGQKGVQSVPGERTAFPHRQENLLITPALIYALNSTLDAIAMQAGKEMRRILNEADGREIHAYVNYAHGDESLSELYGFEEWRQSRLRELKGLYDPKGSFNFYAPVR